MGEVESFRWKTYQIEQSQIGGESRSTKRKALTGILGIAFICVEGIPLLQLRGKVFLKLLSRFENCYALAIFLATMKPKIQRKTFF